MAAAFIPNLSLQGETDSHANAAALARNDVVGSASHIGNALAVFVPFSAAVCTPKNTPKKSEYGGV